MADYYPLIARAIAGLDPSAPGESRRALYERARAALIQQLRSVDPPLSESEITRERLSLEEASRNARKTYANVPSPSPEFDRLEPNMENRGADPEQPYAWDDHIEDTERSTPPAAPQMPQPPTRSRIGSASEREPKRARAGAVF